MRTTYNEDFLDPCECETLERPVKKRCVAYRQETLEENYEWELMLLSFISTHPWLIFCQRLKARVEAVRKKDGLQNLLLFTD